MSMSKAPWWAYYALLAVLGLGGMVVAAKYPPTRAIVLEVIAAAAKADVQSDVPAPALPDGGT